MKKLFIIIPSNRYCQLPKHTVSVIEKTKTPTIFVKQNLHRFYNRHPYIQEIINHQEGVSRARNIGIKKAISLGANILAFTDDDCIITKKWIKNIYNSINDSQKNIVFGRVLPYQPKKHPDKHCPCTFTKKNHQPISTPVSTPIMVGGSNNFAITPQIIKKVGLFSTQIGPGTKIPGGEDIDFNIRIIQAGYPIHYNHQAIVYHNKWLNINDLRRLYQKYTLSFAYVYSYHAFHTNSAYLNILILSFFQEIKYYLIYLKHIFHPHSFIKLMINHNLIVYNYLKGTILSLYYP